MSNGKIKINLDSLKARREWKRHKVKDGHNVFRILPPFGESSNGYAYRKWQIIWGLTDPESGRARPFASSFTSEKKCPVFEFVTKLKKKAEFTKANLQAEGLSDEDIKEQMSGLNKLINDLNPKTVYVYNAADKSGEVGLLELKSTAHKKMKTLMSKYVNEYNQDPTSLNSEDDDSGVWFDVTREGEGFKTEYDVEKCQIKTKKPTGGFSFEDDRSPLPDSVVENYENLAYDLASIYQIKTYEELAEILEANMADIIESCPEANLDNSVIVTTTTAQNRNVVNRAAAVAPKQTAKPVTTRFDDADDEEEQQVSPSRSKKSVAADEDWVREANALLEDN